VGDIEIAGAVAPRARIVVYFAPNTERGFFEAISTAVHDRRHNPSVISISWGALEDEWPSRTMSVIDETLLDAVHLGVTVCCSSGDDGSSGGAPGGAPHVYFPASSPHVLACGGTRLLASGNRITKESVWNDAHGASGGGVSVRFPLPAWQLSANVPRAVAAHRARFQGRGVPDVAGNADPSTGYFLLLAGKQSVTGGTSAVAPLWAGLIARLNQKLGRAVGFLNPFLYGEYARLTRSGALRGVTQGSNGAYKASKGWNPCAGLGTPDGAKLVAALAAVSRK
jgi:kumamolisin